MFLEMLNMRTCTLTVPFYISEVPNLRDAWPSFFVSLAAAVPLHVLSKKRKDEIGSGA